MNKTKTNKGITLVALVITIIVLIILAGVSINAVMNDGLIENSKHARNEFEMAKENETGVIGELYQVTEEEVLKQYFEKNKENLTANYVINEGYIAVTDPTAEQFLTDVGGTYEMWNKENTAKLNDDDVLKCGDILKKDGQIIARVVVYGDVIIDGDVNGEDGTAILLYCRDGNINGEEVEDYQKLAMDVNHDGSISEEDYDCINKWGASMYEIDFYYPPQDPDTLVVIPYVEGE